MNGLHTIQMMPARDRVAAALREAILSHQINPGEELTLKDTAAQLGVSATPVREALQILEREGLIELRPNRGAVVLGITPKRIRDHYQTRAALERAAAILVCQTGAPLEAIEQALSSADDALAHGDSSRYSDQNQAFHWAIWAAAGNDKIQELLSSLWNGLSMGHKVTQDRYAQISMAEHHDIMEALRARDARRAGDLMEHHIIRSMENVLTHLEKEEQKG